MEYPWTQITGHFPPESTVTVQVAITHDGDPIDTTTVVDAVKDAITAAGATSVTAVEYAVTSTPV